VRLLEHAQWVEVGAARGPLMHRLVTVVAEASWGQACGILGGWSSFSGRPSCVVVVLLRLLVAVAGAPAAGGPAGLAGGGG